MPNLICTVPSLREKSGNLQRSTKSSTRNLKKLLFPSPTIKLWNLLQETKDGEEKIRERKAADSPF